jgi:hypothetical protein
MTEEKRGSGAPKKSKETLGVNVPTRLPPSVLAKLDQRCQVDGTSRSAVIRAAVNSYLSPNNDTELLTSWAENSIENTSESIRSGMDPKAARESIFESLMAVRDFKTLHHHRWAEVIGLEEKLSQALQAAPINMGKKDMWNEIKKRQRKGPFTLAVVLEQAKEVFYGGDND